MKVRSRFSYFRDKLQVFFLGFLLGIVLGGGFFLLKLDTYIRELSFYKSLTEKSEPEKITDSETEDKPIKKKTDKTKKNNSTEQIAVNDFSNPDSSSGDSTLPSVFNPENGSDDIVIRKDELLGQKVFSLRNLDLANDADSVAGNPASDRPVTAIAIEYWKSPLNYRGYKFSRNKIAVFGFELNDVESVCRTEGNTYLKTTIGIFRIEPSNDFRQLERVTDESLISKMK
jgi:hypothetical protein